MNQNEYMRTLKRMAQRYPNFDYALFAVAFDHELYRDEAELTEDILEMVIDQPPHEEIVALL